MRAWLSASIDKVRMVLIHNSSICAGVVTTFPLLHARPTTPTTKDCHIKTKDQHIKDVKIDLNALAIGSPPISWCHAIDTSKQANKAIGIAVAYLSADSRQVGISL